MEEEKKGINKYSRTNKNSRVNYYGLYKYDSKRTLWSRSGPVEVSSSTCGLLARSHLHKQWHEPATGFPAHGTAAVATAAVHYIIAALQWWPRVGYPAAPSPRSYIYIYKYTSYTSIVHIYIIYDYKCIYSYSMI